MIKTPPGWGAHVLTQVYQSVTTVRSDPAISGPATVRRIGLNDLGWALRRGMDDFAASRTDVIFLCVFYPLVGLLLARVASGYNLLPLVFPLASGFALIGPLAGVGLNEMSRRRELGMRTSWGDAFGVLRSPAIGSIILLGLILLGMLLFWLVMANMVYNMTLGPQAPVSLNGFIHDIIYTPAGHLMALAGVATGFGFALVAFVISVISFPMLLDQTSSLEAAVRTSAQVVARNPLTMAVWGLIIVGSLVAGSIPLLLGLIVVLPVLGHATWHLYRRAVSR